MSINAWSGLRARTLLEQLPFSSVVYDAEGHPLYANKAFIRLWGVDLSTAPTGYSVLADPELERQGALDVIRRAFAGEVVVTPAVRYDISKVSASGTGHEVWTQGHFFPLFDEHGSVQLVVLMHIDLTERVRTEENLRQALRDLQHIQALTSELAGASTPEEVAAVALERAQVAFGAAAGFVTLVADDGRLMVNLQSVGFTEEQAAQWRRYSTTADTAGTHVIRTGEPLCVRTLAEIEQRFPANLPPLVEQGYPSFCMLPLRTHDNVFGIVAFNFREPRDFDERTLANLMVFANQCAIALERARLYAAEREARSEAEAANRAKSEFLAIMSHELRTPLNAIAGYAELIELGIRGPITDAQRHDLQRIRRSQEHLLALIDDVLSFARIESGRVDLNIADVPLDVIIADAQELIAPQVLAKGLRLEVLHSARGLRVYADAEKLRQVLLNLLSNAVKYTEQGSVTISVGEQDAYARVEVSDTGPGIPAERLSDIFEPFVQIEHGLTRRASGTGLGLAISRDLARKMDGDILVCSREGSGSAFTVLIPLATASINKS